MLILMNVMGYYGFFLGLQYKNSRNLIQQFDLGTYDQTLTRVFKIPYDVPDSLNSETFERADGDFEQDGQIFRIIKKRLYRDTFHIVYIKDTRGTQINKTLTAVARTFADQASDKPAGKTIVPPFIKEYVLKTLCVQQSIPGWQQTIRKETRLSVFIDSFTSSVIHPPERA